MTREEAIQRANEAMASIGFEEQGRGYLVNRLEYDGLRLGQRFHSAEFVKGEVINELVGDPHWAVNYEALFVEQDGSLEPTRREQFSVFVDVATGHTTHWHTL